MTEPGMKSKGQGAFIHFNPVGICTHKSLVARRAQNIRVGIKTQSHICVFQRGMSAESKCAWGTLNAYPLVTVQQVESQHIPATGIRRINHQLVEHILAEHRILLCMSGSSGNDEY